MNLFTRYKAYRARQGVWMAAYKGDIQSVIEILDRGGNIEEDHLTSTPVQAAAEHGHVDTVRALFERGANPNPEVLFRGAALMGAVLSGNVEIVRLFLDNGADVNARDDEHEFTPLMYAVQECNTEMIRLLLDNGAEINHCDYEAV